MTAEAQGSERTSEPIDFQALIETIPALVVCALADGSAEFANRAWHEYTGRSSPERAGSSWQTAIHHDDLPKLIQEWTVAAAAGMFETEARVRRADGEYQWFAIRKALAVSRDQAGKPSLRALIACEDIQERKQAQARFQQNEQRWQTAFENSAIGIMMRDRADRFLATNRAFRNMLGYTESELYQLCEMDFIHEEDRELNLELIEELWEGKRQHFQIEKRYRRKNGTLVWVRNNAALVPGSGGVDPFLFTVVEDITQRKQEESVRRYIIQRYRVMVETANDAVVCVDENGAILLANPATMRVFGYEPAELTGKPLTVLMPEYLRHLHEGGFRRYLATGQRHMNWQGTELTGLRKNGQEFPVEISFGEVTADGHRIFTGFIRDISERKQAEEALRRSEEKWRAVFENSTVGVALADMNGRFLAANSAYQSIVGYSEEELRSLTFLDLTPEDYRHVSFQQVEELKRGTRTQFQIEKQYRRKDGSLRWVINNVSLVPGSELMPPFILGLSEDITERKEAEEAFRLVVVGTAATTGSDFFRSLVQHMAQALRARYAFVTTCDDQKHARSLAFWKGDGFGENFEFNVADTPCENVLIGEVCHYRQGLQGLFPLDKVLADWQAESYFGLPMLDRSNRVIGHIAILDDKPMEADLRAIDLLKIFASRAAAELKRQKAEDELQAALQERERLRRAQADLAHINRVSTMGELTASLAHEIKQPIGAAITNAQACLRFLKRDQPDMPEAREAALEMVRDATRAADIIDRVRSLYRKGSPHQEMVDVNEVIREMVVMLRNEANRHSVKMRTELDETVPQVMADRVQLQQVLMNIMLNGIEAMRDTTGELNVKSQLAQDGQLMISVSDMGVGLPAGKADTIFDAFFTTKPQGSGLGLAITRSIVESHGGRVWAAANSGQGATFHFTLPQKTAAHA